MGDQLRGRVALVTGGGSGIGRAIVDALAADGAAVAISGRRREVIEGAAEAVRAAGGEAVAVAGDVSRPEDCARLVAETVARLGGLHVVVNNAGIARGGPIESMPDNDIDAVIDIDLKGPIHLMRAALPALRKGRDDGGTSVINISSSVTQHPVPHFSVYSAAKAGLDMLTRCWAVDLAPDRIRVNAICPGIVRTPIFETMMPQEQIEGFLDHFDDVVPLGRAGEPGDIARLARFLAGSESSYMTGAVIPIDGALSLSGAN